MCQQLVVIFMVISSPALLVCTEQLCHYENDPLQIQLDEDSRLWAPTGTYSTVEFHLSTALNTSKIVQISHSEKFPSRSHHATFVSSVRPMTAELMNSKPVTVTLTIFAPSYVSNGARVLITLIVREKPVIGQQHTGCVSNCQIFQSCLINLLSSPFFLKLRLAPLHRAQERRVHCEEK